MGRGRLTIAQTQTEANIAQKEAHYLESTPNGNIVTGFDNYIKGGSGGAASRKKPVSSEQNRLFANSSISYKVSDVSRPGQPRHLE